MPRLIVKPEQDRDFYIEWSSVVDAPVRFGTREELVSIANPDYFGERFDRADLRGSSMFPEFDEQYIMYGFDDKTFIIGELDGFMDELNEVIKANHEKNLHTYFTVKRENMIALCQELENNESVLDIIETNTEQK